MYLNTFQSKAIGMQYPRHTINQQDLYNDISSFLFFFFFPIFSILECVTARVRKTAQAVREYAYPHYILSNNQVDGLRISFLGCITSSLYIFFCPKGQCSKWLSKNGLISLRVLLFLIQKREKKSCHIPTYIFFSLQKIAQFLIIHGHFFLLKEKKISIMTSLLF